ncbi:MAG TPA: hypothetical protein VJB57_06765 [Dehalococcoidia bacterium]|nr:hypothetical protein [Dehalococcoidia bacterium]
MAVKVGSGVSVRVAVGVGVSVKAGVGVRVGVRVEVAFGTGGVLGALVAVATGVCPGAKVGVALGVRVAPGVGDGHGVALGSGVADGDGAGPDVGDGPGVEGAGAPLSLNRRGGVPPGVWVGSGWPLGVASARGIDVATAGILDRPGPRVLPGSGELKAASSRAAARISSRSSGSRRCAITSTE